MKIKEEGGSNPGFISVTAYFRLGMSSKLAKFILCATSNSLAYVLISTPQSSSSLAWDKLHNHYWGAEHPIRSLIKAASPWVTWPLALQVFYY